jgi:hypothetical protein
VGLDERRDGRMISEPRSFAGEPVEHAARAARLPLSADRRQIIGPALEMIYALIDTLDSVRVGETPPATAFDARWEG